jgi:hypothetical protein
VPIPILEKILTGETICLSVDERNLIESKGVKLLRLYDPKLSADVYKIDTRKKGDDFCMQCGHVAPKVDFLKDNGCPNPSCQAPEHWE